MKSERRHSEETVEKSPKVARLYFPSYAGEMSPKNRQVVHMDPLMSYNGMEIYVNNEDDHYSEDGLVDDGEADEYVHIQQEINAQIHERGEGEGPPTNLSPEQIRALDDKATVEEIEKLEKLSVIEPHGSEPDEDAVLLDTTCVYDWRYREMWRRRCRIVAREYKTSSTNEEQFAPTSSMFIVRVLMMLDMLRKYQAWVCDVKDAFLMVKQREKVLVSVPQWVQQLGAESGNPLLQCGFWKLGRCLPGQRNAALRWSDHFRELICKHGFESFPGMPTLFRCIEKDMLLTIHVDDLLILGQPAQ